MNQNKFLKKRQIQIRIYSDCQKFVNTNMNKNIHTGIGKYKYVSRTALCTYNEVKEILQHLRLLFPIKVTRQVNFLCYYI